MTSAGSASGYAELDLASHVLTRASRMSAGIATDL